MDVLTEDNNEHFPDFMQMQGVSDHQQIFNLSPLQIGVFLAFAPPVRGCSKLSAGQAPNYACL